MASHLLILQLPNRPVMRSVSRGIAMLLFGQLVLCGHPRVTVLVEKTEHANTDTTEQLVHHKRSIKP